MRIQDIVNNESLQKALDLFKDLEYVDKQFITTNPLNKKYFNRWELEYNHYDVKLYYYYQLENVKIYDKEKFLIGFNHGKKRIKSVVDLSILRQNLKNYNEDLINESFLEIKKLEIETPEIEKIIGHSGYRKYPNSLEILRKEISLENILKISKCLKIRFENIKISIMQDRIILMW